MFCPYCGKENKEDIKYCTYCGNKVIEEETLHEVANQNMISGTEKKSKKWIIILIAAIIGLVGVAIGGYFLYHSFFMKSQIQVPTLSVKGGTYDSVQKVSITTEDNEKLTVFYTTDGKDPTMASRKYDYGTTIEINTSMILKCIAADKTGNTSEVTSEEYIINGKKDETNNNIVPKIDELTASIEGAWVFSSNTMSGYTATATSTLLNQGDNSYYASNVLDNNSATAWVENADEWGIGEKITLTYHGSEAVTIKKIYLLAGYTKDEATYNNNGYPTSLYLSFNNNGNEIGLANVNLSQTMSMQVITLTNALTLTTGDSLCFEIKGVNSVNTNADRDTAISEIVFQ